MVEYHGARYFVRGSLRLREGGYSWDEHLLELDAADGAAAASAPASATGDATKVWISVEEDPTWK
jgi:uncharacterized protein DUF4178